MMITISVVNQKGGVGKTTTAVNIANVLRMNKKKVILVDMDPQHSASLTYQAKIDGATTVYDILNVRDDSDTKEAIQKTKMGDIIAGDLMLLELEPALLTAVGSEGFLKHKLEEIAADYDYCIIDTPPNPGRYTTMSLIASDYCLVPLMPGRYSVAGLSQILSTINTVKKRVNKDLINLGVLIVRFDKRKKIDRDVEAKLPEVGKTNGFDVFDTRIRVSQEVETAQANDVSVLDFPKSYAAQDYKAAVKEILNMIKKKGV